jgi:putative transposase
MAVNPISWRIPWAGLMAVVMTTASVQEWDGARWLLSHLPGGGKKLRKTGVDGGFSGRLQD